jgi:hypothetical protein
VKRLGRFVAIHFERLKMLTAEDMSSFLERVCVCACETYEKHPSINGAGNRLSTDF